MIFKGKIGIWFWLLLIGVNIAMVYEGIHGEIKGREILAVAGPDRDKGKKTGMDHRCTR